MKRLLITLLSFLVITNFTWINPALAGDAANGAKLFTANCASCHMGGGNVVMGNKTLKKDALEKYSMASLEGIVNQVTNGKNAMPAFGKKLSPQEIEDVATYVLDQAEKGW